VSLKKIIQVVFGRKKKNRVDENKKEKVEIGEKKKMISKVVW